MGKITRAIIILSGIGFYLSYLINFMLSIESIYMTCIIGVLGFAILSVIVTTFSRSILSGAASSNEARSNRGCRKI